MLVVAVVKYAVVKYVVVARTVVGTAAERAVVAPFVAVVELLLVGLLVEPLVEPLVDTVVAADGLAKQPSVALKEPQELRA